MSPAFRSLRIRNYRLFAAGQVVSNTGTWMQRTAQDWLVLSLSHSSGVALGVVTGLQFLPVLLFGLYGGVIADRYDKRRVLIGAQAAMGVLALVLGLLDVTGLVALWQVYLLAAGLGFASILDGPVRQSFIREMVGPRDLPNAVSLNAVTFNAARVVGPAVAGALISTIGTGSVFLLNAASFAAVIYGLLRMRRAELFPAARLSRAKGQLREGLSHVRGRPELLTPIILMGLIGLLGLNFPVTIALMAKTTFHQGAGAYGVLGSCLAAGSLAGALLAARRSGRDLQPRPRTYLLAGGLFGVFEAISGVMPTYLLFAIMLVPVGMAFLVFSTAVNTSIQLAAGPQFRGRVMALYFLVFLGGTPIGAPVIGLVAESFGPRSSLYVGGVASAVSALGCALVMRRRRPDSPPPAERYESAPTTWSIQAVNDRTSSGSIAGNMLTRN